MVLGKSKLIIIAIAIIAMLLTIVVTFQISLEVDAYKKSDTYEPPLSVNHEETIYVGTNITPDERRRLAEKQKQLEEAENKNLEPGELSWRPRKKETKKEGKEKSTYEKDQSVRKPAVADNPIN